MADTRRDEESVKETTPDHVPVMLAEVLEALQVRPEGRYLDVTGGAGGHSAAILERLGPTGRLVICECNTRTAEALKTRFAGDTRVQVVRDIFSQIFEVVEDFFDGVLADLGVSSMELAGVAPGIAFMRKDDALDMRLDNRRERTAAEVLAEESAEELARLFYELGGERASRKIAAAIVTDRKDRPFVKAGDLSELCERVLGKYYRGQRIHPATKIFQALRMAVNDETGEIASLLQQAPTRLTPGGRMVVIAFHEGEDRPVKRAFRSLAATGEFSLPTRKSLKPSATEAASNPRARSAQLRVLVRN